MCVYVCGEVIRKQFVRPQNLLMWEPNKDGGKVLHVPWKIETAAQLPRYTFALCFFGIAHLYFNEARSIDSFSDSLTNPSENFMPHMLAKKNMTGEKRRSRRRRNIREITAKQHYGNKWTW